MSNRCFAFQPSCLVFRGLGHLRTREGGEVLERVVRRIARYLRLRGLLDVASGGVSDDDADLEDQLAASAVASEGPPAGPQWEREMAPRMRRALEYGDKPLCASLDGFTLHAATRAGALDTAGREALLRYVLRPPIAQERLERRPDGLVRIMLKRGPAVAALPIGDLGATPSPSHGEVLRRAR